MIIEKPSSKSSVEVTNDTYEFKFILTFLLKVGAYIYIPSLPAINF